MSELTLKQPPHSDEAEQSLLGGLLLDNQAFERVADVVSGEDFYRDDHRRIWKHISRLIEAGKPADMVTVSESIDASEDKGKTGGPAYLGGLAQNTPSALHIKRYAELVREKSIQRHLAQAGTEIAEAALSGGQMEAGQLLDEAEAKILKISESSARRGNGPLEIKPLLSRVFERIDNLYHREDHSGVTGVPTGFVDLDQKTAGLQPGDLIVIAGRPSMGKTALALNIAEHVSVEKGLPVVIFSMEMSGIQLAQRLAGSYAKVDQHLMRTGKLSDEEWARLSQGIGQLHDKSIFIDDAGGLTVLDLRARARRLKRQHSKLGLIVIDYLQLMEAKGRGENRATEVAEISRSLKAMAKELDVPVVALSQLNRAVDQRPDRRPNMSDLRESGAIEQDADVILFIYREEVYTPDLPDAERGIAEVIIAKQRNGPIGTVRLTFIGQFTRFENYSGMDTYVPRRPRTTPKVRNFTDYKTAAGGADA